ncbi:hypothetical protein BGZ95_006707, partial [Linnemannia exigua]
VILNTIEVYGRMKIMDSHRDSFAVRKDRPVANSLPPPIQTPYKRVWPLTIMAPEGERLTIGTRHLFPSSRHQPEAIRRLYDT